tara:strand:+ start:1236 stop:1505 length:270 start_codon:yes stop_codon:yes gene_type:complete
MKGTFGFWLKKEIESRFGQSQGCKLFSQQIGYPILTIYRWIRNERTPSGIALALIVKVLSGNGEDHNEKFEKIAGQALDQILNSKQPKG